MITKLPCKRLFISIVYLLYRTESFLNLPQNTTAAQAGNTVSLIKKIDTYPWDVRVWFLQ